MFINDVRDLDTVRKLEEFDYTKPFLILYLLDHIQALVNNLYQLSNVTVAN